MLVFETDGERVFIDAAEVAASIGRRWDRRLPHRLEPICISVKFNDAINIIEPQHRHLTRRTRYLTNIFNVQNSDCTVQCSAVPGSASRPASNEFVIGPCDILRSTSQLTFRAFAAASPSIDYLINCSILYGYTVLEQII